MSFALSPTYEENPRVQWLVERVRERDRVPNDGVLTIFGGERPAAPHVHESLRAMTDIATGDGGSLGDNGLLAEGRRQPHIGLPDKIDLPGLPPIDLPDWDTRVPGLPALNDPEGDRPRGSITNDHGY